MRLIRLAVVAGPLLFVPAADVSAQTGEPSVPNELSALDFMLGEWTVEGAFRTPDFIGEDRTLWYLTSQGGVTRFDGRSWVSYATGEAPEADSVLSQISGRGDPYQFTHARDVARIQDDFVILIDDGSTSGSTWVFFDSNVKAWTATSLHAPTNATTTSTAPFEAGLPVFVGRGTDRRGDRTFRRRYEVVSERHYRIRTDVSFDEGVTWIDDQVVQDVRRR